MLGKRLKLALEEIVMMSDEMQECKEENEFCKGAAFAYRCVLLALQNEGKVNIEKIRKGIKGGDNS